MAQGISEAMNNTALGLMIALPMLLIHGVLTAKSTALIEDIESGCHSFWTGSDFITMENLKQVGRKMVLAVLVTMKLDTSAPLNKERKLCFAK